MPGREGRDRHRGEDVHERLLARRVVVVSGVLTDQEATRASAELMTLDAEGQGAVTLHLNCPSGDLDASLALTDTVALMTVEVTAHCRGQVGGSALAAFTAADRRVCSVHAMFRFRAPEVGISGRAEEIDTQASAFRTQVDRLIMVIADASGQAHERVAADMQAGRILDAEQAVTYGLVHEIAHPTSTRSSDSGRRQT